MRMGVHSQPTIHPKSIQQGIQKKMQFWLQLGRLLGWFLIDFGSKMEVFGRSWGPKNQEKSILGGVLGGLGGIFGPKSLKMSATVDLNDPFGPQIGGENPSKIHPEAIEKVIVFLITFGIDF